MKETQTRPDYAGRRIVVREIKAAGYYDETGRFRLLGCVGKITPVKASLQAAENTEPDQRVA